MNKKLLQFLPAAVAAALCATSAPPLHAQAVVTDVTETYLQNADFETDPTGLPADHNVYDIPGWTEDPVAGYKQYYKLGTIAYDTGYDGPAIPAVSNGTSVQENNTALLACKVYTGART